MGTKDAGGGLGGQMLEEKMQGWILAQAPSLLKCKQGARPAVPTTVKGFKLDNH